MASFFLYNTRGKWPQWGSLVGVSLDSWMTLLKWERINPEFRVVLPLPDAFKAR